MRCKEVKELLWFYLEKEIPAEDAEKIEKHLEACADCRQEVEIRREIMDSLHRIAEKELPGDYHEELMRKLQEANREKSLSFPRKIIHKKQPFYRWGLIAAAVVVLVAAGGIDGLMEMRAGQRSAMQKESVRELAIEDEMPAAEDEKMEEVADTPMIARMTLMQSAENQMNLLVTDEEEAMAEIQRLIAAAGGYEEPSETGSVYAVIPMEGYFTFIESLNEVGAPEWLEEKAAEEGAGFRTIQIFFKTE